ncbi:MAG: hypothetical protein PF549_01050 [Patescibacteria group bacterium]|jgi:hypothetical protein|nr:hypothetical protein [Patescibacteria group bacterium]
MKKCYKCGELKPLTEFYKDRKSKDGLSYKCKKCDYKQTFNWRKNNPEKVKENKRKWRKNNHEKVIESSRRWRENNPEKAKENYRDWYKNNPEKSRKSCREWRKNNMDKVRIIMRGVMRKKRATLKGTLNNRMGVMIWQSLRKNKAGHKWEALVGYTVNDLMEHLESLFTSDMSWEKLLNGEIHIDHIKPKSLFNFTSPEDKEFKECWALENLQPLEAIENIKKGNKY